jgi:hypothetical protein
MPGGGDYHARVSRGERFRILRDSEETRACLDDLKADFQAKLASSDDTEVAMALWHRIRAIGQLEQVIQARISDGEMAAKEMKMDGDYQPEISAPAKSGGSRRKGR